MTLEANEQTYCVGMWMIHGEVPASDPIKKLINDLALDFSPSLPVEYLLTLYCQGDDPWVLHVRQRIVVDDKTFDSDDRKHVFTVTFKDAKNENEARAKVEDFIKAFLAQFDHFQCEFQPIYDNFIEWLDRRREQDTLPDWMHVKVEKL